MEENGVTYCARTQTLTATFQGLIDECISDDGTIILDDSCLEPEELDALVDSSLRARRQERDRV